jgi:nitrogenase molybdenum-iron protein alpha chain
MNTDMQEDQIVFGGEKKLQAAIARRTRFSSPRPSPFFSTCPVGLIGDDVHAVARDEGEARHQRHGFSCEGYKGVSQSAGHHIANNGVFKHIIGLTTRRGDGEVQHQHARRIQHRRRRVGN